MSTTQTTNLGLTKATPGTGEPFSTSVVNTNLDTIDSAVGELQDSVSLGTLNTLVSGISYQKYGKLVYVYIYAYTTTSASMYEISTFPEGYRPSANTGGFVWIEGADTTHGGVLEVLANGKVRIWPTNIGANKKCFGYLSYLIG